MKIKYCTITGADDKVEPADLMDLSLRFPFVEWGILFTDWPKSRYPHYKWVHEFLHHRMVFSDATGIVANISAHLCGFVTDQFITDPTNVYMNNGWPDHNPGFEDYGGREDKWAEFQRIQVNVDLKDFQAQFANNTGGKGNADTTIEGWPDWASYHIIRSCWLLDSFSGVNRQFIVQDHEGNAELVKRVLDLDGVGNQSFSFLFDSSKGTGKEIDGLPDPYMGFLCGYAGGISPDNIDSILGKIADKGPGVCTIDMESGVRTDGELDLDKVEKVLRTVHFFNSDQS